jgi:hypothetical protein
MGCGSSKVVPADPATSANAPTKPVAGTSIQPAAPSPRSLPVSTASEPAPPAPRPPVAPTKESEPPAKAEEPEPWPPASVSIEGKTYSVGSLLGKGVWADVFKGTGPDDVAAAIKMLRPLKSGNLMPGEKDAKGEAFEEKFPPRNPLEQQAENVIECRIHKFMHSLAVGAASSECAMVPAILGSDATHAAIEFISATSLEDYLRTKDRSSCDAADLAAVRTVCLIVVRKVVALLQRAADAHFSHRDLNDGNIMLNVKARCASALCHRTRAASEATAWRRAARQHARSTRRRCRTAALAAVRPWLGTRLSSRASILCVRACAVQTEPVRGPEDVDVWLFDFGKSMASIDGKMVSGGMWDPKKKPIPNPDDPTYDACRMSDYNATSDIVRRTPHPAPHESPLCRAQVSHPHR